MEKVNSKDVAYALAKGGLGMIPVVGAPASELLSILVASPLEKRREEWMTDVGHRLQKLEEEGKISLEQLRGSGLFIDIVMQATQSALKTSEAEKIAYFKNVIEKTALGESPERAISQVYLNLLDRYTLWHIRILSLFHDPDGWFQRANLTKPNISAGGLSHVLLTALPELKGRKEFYTVIWAELERDGMHRSGSLEGLMSASGMFVSRTTDFGEQFLRFIKCDV